MEMAVYSMPIPSRVSVGGGDSTGILAVSGGGVAIGNGIEYLLVDAVSAMSTLFAPLIF
jgi:hypothetical protein